MKITRQRKNHHLLMPALASGVLAMILILQENLSDWIGNRGANVIGGFGSISSVPGNNRASGVLGVIIADGGGLGALLLALFALLPALLLLADRILRKRR